MPSLPSILQAVIALEPQRKLRLGDVSHQQRQDSNLGSWVQTSPFQQDPVLPPPHGRETLPPAAIRGGQHMAGREPSSCPRQPVPAALTAPILLSLLRAPAPHHQERTGCPLSNTGAEACRAPPPPPPPGAGSLWAANPAPHTTSEVLVRLEAQECCRPRTHSWPLGRPLATVLVSEGCQNKAPYSRGQKYNRNASSHRPEARSLKSRCLQGPAPSEGSREGPSLLLQLLGAPGSPPGLIPPASTSFFTWPLPSSFCAPSPLLLGTPATASGPIQTQCILVLTRLH